jgi:hypothetical protein
MLNRLRQSRVRHRNPGISGFFLSTGEFRPMPEVRDHEQIDEHMNARSQENLKLMRFEGQLLPNWAQLLFLAARLCPVAQDASLWFARLTSRSGADDARTVLKQCGLLRASIQKHRKTVSSELQRSRYDGQSKQILAAWMYSLDTMILEARGRKTCSWIVEGTEEAPLSALDDGDVTLRSV